MENQETTNQSNHPESNHSQDKSKNLFTTKNLNTAGKVFFVVGLLMMIGTFFGYNTVVCRDGCNYNIGLLNEKSNLINIGGFLFLGGCVLVIQNKA
ncbi:MAG TPA: hypothetical protein VK184_03590 [Nostocaceae cyanobacterium]|nr:hypothetical protein [Nostocaceae cyanobacterium]